MPLPQEKNGLYSLLARSSSPAGPDPLPPRSADHPASAPHHTTRPDALICGIDEAGRGAVLGPMVVCAVFLSPDAAMTLSAAGVTDSKKVGAGDLGRRRRAQLSREIRRAATLVRVAAADARMVDEWVTATSLNDLERHLVRILLDGAPTVARIRADGQRLFASLSSEYSNFFATNRADATFAEVAAASVVAKAERDRLIAEILAPHQVHFGPISGQGYPNRATARFLKAYYEHHGSLPSEVRHTWRWPPLDQFRQTSLALSRH